MRLRLATLAALLVLAVTGTAPHAVAQPAPGTVVRVFGDLTHADHVGVIVPGSDMDASSYDDPHNTASTAEMARALLGGMQQLEPGARSATVAWVGYRTPHGLGVDAASGRLARPGASALETYVRNLRARVGASAHITLFCHSYGSVVCGLAAPGLAVDDIVFLGSPGVRRDSVAAMHTRARVWAARGGADWIRRVPHVRVADLGHGRDPVDPRFGARVVAMGRGVGHRSYLLSGSPQAAALARIATGAAVPA